MWSEWAKSVRSNPSGNCVQVSQAFINRQTAARMRAELDRSAAEREALARKPAATVLVRDSKNPDGAVLAFDDAEWKAFVAGIHEGQPELVGR